MRNLLLDKAGQLRSGWRAAVFLLAFIIPAAFLGAIFDLIEKFGLFGSSRHSAEFLAVRYFPLLGTALLIGWGCGKLFEKVPFRALGAAFTGGWLKHFALGLFVGGATLGVAVLAAMIFGGLRFEINSADGVNAILYSLGASLAAFAVAAAFEEALFRGYLLQTFSRSGLAWLAILLTSLFFGAVHVENPGSGLISTANTVIAGVWFSVAYLKTRDLWFVWGIHLMWNFAQGSIFGIEVSGLTNIARAPLLKEIDSGPTWLTGTTYGIEGGIACTLALVLSMGLIYFLPIPKPDPDMLALSDPPAVAGG